MIGSVSHQTPRSDAKRRGDCFTPPPARMTIKHSGFKGRLLGAAEPTRGVLLPASAFENETEQTQSFRLTAVETDLSRLVQGFLAPLFELFDFSNFDDFTYGQIIDRFVKRAAAG